MRALTVICRRDGDAYTGAPDERVDFIDPERVIVRKHPEGLVVELRYPDPPPSHRPVYQPPFRREKPTHAAIAKARKKGVLV